jgi:tetratricopeptide (TPR) repeat protein
MSSHFKFYLHYERMIVGDVESALRFGAESLAMRDLDAVHRYEVLLNLSNLSHGDPALKLARRAKALDINRREAYAVEASILLDLGESEAALEVIEAMEKIPVPSFPQWTHKKEWYGWKAS